MFVYVLYTVMLLSISYQVKMELGDLLRVCHQQWTSPGWTDTGLCRLWDLCGQRVAWQTLGFWLGWRNHVDVLLAWFCVGYRMAQYRPYAGLLTKRQLCMADHARRSYWACAMARWRHRSRLALVSSHPGNKACVAKLRSKWLQWFQYQRHSTEWPLDVAARLELESNTWWRHHRDTFSALLTPIAVPYSIFLGR